MMLLAAINWHSFFFFLFAAVACVFALAVLFSGNIVRMAFYLVLSLGATAGLFFLAGAEFVGAMQLMIYVGGTLVLLIFGVMLTAQEAFITMRTRSGEWILGLLLGGALLMILVLTAFSVREWTAPSPQWQLQQFVTNLEEMTKDRQQLAEQAKRLAAAAEAPEHQLEQLTTLNNQAQDEFAETLEAMQAFAQSRSTGPQDQKLGQLVRLVAEQLSAAATPLSAQLQEQMKVLKEQTRSRANQAAAPARVAAIAESSSALAEQLRLASATLRPRLQTVADSKETTRIGEAFAGIRVDRLEQPNDVLRAGMSGYLLPFVIVSVHLLVVLLGAAYMARPKRRAASPE